MYAKDKGVLNKMEINGTGECFFTLKDHKENFVNNPITRLQIPLKTKSEELVKLFIDSINKELRNILIHIFYKHNLLVTVISTVEPR